MAARAPSARKLRRNVAEDVYVSVIPGMEVALVGAIEVLLPEQRGRRIKVASIPAFLAMKAAALYSPST